MEILFPSEEKKIKALSSIDQYRNFIATYERGGWTPIEFDFVDYIKCIGCEGGDKYEVKTRPIIIEFDDKIGYHFPVGECRFTTDDYLKFDRDGTELLPLPECYGDGFYERALDGEEIVNFDDAALGTRNNYRLKVGQDYYLADEILPASDSGGVQ